MLTAMFSGSFALNKADDGSIFIDRDGEMFKYILIYLRDGVVDVEPKHREALLREARYFQLKGMVQLLKDKASRLRSVKSFFPRCHTLDMWHDPASGEEGADHDNNPAPNANNANPPAAAANANAAGTPLFFFLHL